jgi:hypothetical protein
LVLGLLGLGPLSKMTLTCLGLYSFAYCWRTGHSHSLRQWFEMWNLSFV